MVSAPVGRFDGPTFRTAAFDVISSDMTHFSHPFDGPRSAGVRSDGTNGAWTRRGLLAALGGTIGGALGGSLLARPSWAEGLLPAQEVASAAMGMVSEGAHLPLDPSELSPFADFYAPRQYRAFWTASGDDGIADGRRLEAAKGIVGLESHGLPSRDAVAIGLATDWRAMADRSGGAAAATASERARLERRFMEAWLDAARTLATGLVSPQTIAGLHVDVATFDRSTLLADLAAGGSPRALLEAQAPGSAAYHRLREKYAVLRQLIGEGRWKFPIDPGPDLVPGTQDFRVAEVRARLHELGDLTWVEEHADWYDERLVAGVYAFQLRHGLKADGVAGARTIAEMNVSATSRLGQLAVALERMRWRSREIGRRYVWVNLPDFEVRLIDEGKAVFMTRSVIGSPAASTPEFNGTMSYLVANPSWYVPTGIAKTEIVPEIRKNPDYMKENRLKRLGPNRYVQLPGPKNALGKVKFMFPNEHDIYLHDTPWKELFARDLRAYSHGCVRLEKPHDFAREILTRDRDGAWEKYEAALKSGKETRINFETPIPVVMTYQTAWVDPEGQIQIRRDVYQRDRAILSALTEKGLVPPPLPAGADNGYDTELQPAIAPETEAPYHELSAPPSAPLAPVPQQY